MEDVKEYEKSTKELTERPATVPQKECERPPQTLMEMASFALQRGDGLEVIEKLMDLQDRHESKEAKKAFVKARAAYLECAPRVEKDKENSQYNSKYSSKESLINTIGPHIAKFGFDYQFEIKQGDDITVSCRLTHIDGHSESVSMSGPPDTSGSKNKIQQIKSTITYLEVATFEAVTGTASVSGNLDDDGNAAGCGPVLSDKQVSQILDMINSKGVDESAFLKYMEAESVESIPAKLFGKAMNTLKKAKGRDA